MKLLLTCLGFCALVTGAWAANAATTPVKNDVKFTGTYFTPDQLSVKPVAKQLKQPRYPSDMSREHIKGQAEIAFVINTKGVPEEVQVAAATNQSFGEAAVTAVKQWRFKPGQKDGVAVRTAVLQKIEFSLDN